MVFKRDLDGRKLGKLKKAKNGTFEKSLRCAHALGRNYHTYLPGLELQTETRQEKVANFAPHPFLKTFNYLNVLFTFLSPIA